MGKQNYMINDFSLDHVRNRHEAIVLNFMREKLPGETDFCGCNLCLEDVYAVAMNTLPAHYVQRSSIILKKEPPSDADIARTVEDAFDKVKVRPNHS